MASGRARFRTWHIVAISVGGMLIAFSIGIGMTAPVIWSASGAKAEARGTTSPRSSGETTIACPISPAFASTIPTNGARAGHSASDTTPPIGRVFAAPGYPGYADDGRDPEWFALFLAVTGLVAYVSSWSTVRARTRRGFFGRLVVEAPDGSLIWPAGRLRKSPKWSPVGWPWSWTFDRPHVGSRWIFMAVVPPIVYPAFAHGRYGLDYAAGLACVYGFCIHAWGWAGGVSARVPSGTTTLDGSTWGGPSDAHPAGPPDPSTSRVGGLPDPRIRQYRQCADVHVPASTRDLHSSLRSRTCISLPLPTWKLRDSLIWIEPDTAGSPS